MTSSSVRQPLLRVDDAGASGTATGAFSQGGGSSGHSSLAVPSSREHEASSSSMPRSASGGSPGASPRSAAQLRERFGKQEILEGVESRELVPAHLQTDFQTVMNTVNLYVGAGLLSMPYAMKIGGWLGLGVLTMAAAMSCTTGHFISFACDALPPGVAPSYPALGKAAFGPAGEWILLGAVMLEFWGALSMCLIIVWRSLSIALSAPTICFLASAYCVPVRAVVVGLTLAVAIPVILIRSFSRLTSVAMSGVISSAVLCTVMITAWSLDPTGALVNDPSAHQHTVVDWPHLPISAGIFIVSLSGHAGLPSLRRGMRTPSHFPSCLRSTFLCILLLYATMALFGYLYFGESAQVLVTGNLDATGSLAGVVLLRWGPFSVSLSQALSLLVAMSVFTTVPPLVYVLAEIITDFVIGVGLLNDSGGDQAVECEQGAGPKSSNFDREGWEVVVRAAVLTVGYVMALFCYDYLARLESLVGGVLSMTASLILPSLVFYSLRGSSLSRSQTFGLGAFMMVALLTPLCIVYSNATQK